MKINWFALNEIKPFDKPEEEKTPKIKEGWLNEAKDYYFSLDDMTEEPYRLTVTGFTDCEVELYQLNSTQAHIGRGVTWGEIPQAPEASFYDFLQPFVTQEELPTSSSYQLFCLRLTGTAPGKWQGEIRATQGKISVSKTLTFEVLPLLLPTQTAPTLELWQYPFAVARYYQIEPKDYFNKAHCERIAESLAYYAEAGGDTIVPTIVHDPWNHQTYDAYPSLVTWQQSGEKMTFDFTWLDQYVALGFNQKIKCFSMLPWEDKIYYFDEVGVLQEQIYPVNSPQWQEIWRDFLTAFVQHLEEKGWFDLPYIAIDERPAETLASVLQLIKEHPNQEGNLLKVSCALNYQSFDHTLLEQIADLAIYALYIGILISPIEVLINSTEQFQKGYASFKRFVDILDETPEILNSPNAIDLTTINGKIAFENVSFYYDKTNEVLNNVNLQIPAGKTIALVGPSGGGKTTLCSLIPRFYDVNSGQITIDDIDIKAVTLKSLRNAIGIVQQDVYMFAGTVLENISYGNPTATFEEIVAAAKKANIHDFIMSLAEGYNSHVGEHGVKLSGGQKQRLAIARVFLKNPPILILDEATSALDNESEQHIQKSLEELATNRTTIVIAHRLSTIKNADEIIVINDNGIQEQGTHEKLLTQNGLYAKYYNMQFENID